MKPARHVHLLEWQSLSPNTEPALRDRALTPASDVLVKRLQQAGQLEVTELRKGLSVRAFSFVGSLTIDDLCIHIRPKLGADVLPTFMRYALHFQNVSYFKPSPVQIEDNGFVDLVAVLLISEVDQLLHTGIFRDYRPTDAWLSSPRGRLRMLELGRGGPVQRVALPCHYQELTAKLPLNQIVVGAVASIRPHVGNRRIAMELASREMLLRDLCGDGFLTGETLDAARAACDRRSAYYEPILALARLILRAAGPSFVTQGEAVHLPGFLFDMNVLFEQFVARLCQDHAPIHLKVEAQEKSHRAYRYAQNPFGWRLPHLRPDIVIRDARRKPVLVLDTKYKALTSVRPSPADLYQLTLYSMAFGRHAHVPACIVYPSVSGPQPESVLDFAGFTMNDTLARVGLRAIDLRRCSEALSRNDRPTLERIVDALLAPPGDVSEAAPLSPPRQTVPRMPLKTDLTEKMHPRKAPSHIHEEEARA